MTQFLVLGDLHLSTTGPLIPSVCPDFESLDVDAIISIGDIIDDNADHATNDSIGSVYEERGRKFFEKLNEIGIPILIVPGNHDPLACTQRLVEGLNNIIIVHHRVVDGSSIEGQTLDGLRFVGLGCEQFDLTPTFGYDQYPGIVPDLTTVESVEQTATQIATTVESVIGRFLDGELNGQTAAAELGIAPERQETCANELQELVDEFEMISELLADGTGTTVLLSHESPFHVTFDYHHSSGELQQYLHRGSIPLKMAIVAAAPDIVFSGHMHCQGRDVIETLNGYANLYNPGSPGVAFVEIDTETGSLRVIE